MTYVMSALLCFIIPWTAHIVGTQLKEGIGGVAAAKLVISLVLIIGTLLGIAYLREKYFEGTAIQEILGIEMDVRIVTLLFFCVNILIFIVTTWTAYASTHPTRRLTAT
jgi:hypothetical protein